MSWEARGRPEVCVGIPHLGTVPTTWALAFAKLRHPPSTIYSFHRGSPIDIARNSIVDKFLDVGGKWLLFMDTDNLPSEGALERLMSHNVPICSGLYYRRHLDRPGMAPHPAVWKLVPAGAQVTCPACKAVHTAKEGKYQPILNPPPNRLLECDAIGMGFCLIHRRVFEKVPRPWFRWTLGWVDPGLSEDFSACELFKEYGFRILCDTGCRVGHCTDLIVDGEGRIASPGV